MRIPLESLSGNAVRGNQSAHLGLTLRIISAFPLIFRELRTKRFLASVTGGGSRDPAKQSDEGCDSLTSFISRSKMGGNFVLIVRDEKHWIIFVQYFRLRPIYYPLKSDQVIFDAFFFF
jgi:hypothetical protein